LFSFFRFLILLQKAFTIYSTNGMPNLFTVNKKMKTDILSVCGSNEKSPDVFLVTPGLFAI